jgi:succinate dehydrogenase / fumarate reductase, iron-sulfur subunit
MPDLTARFVIKRKANPKMASYWEEFDLRSRPGMNVVIALVDIAANPVDRFEKTTTPIMYESNCLEETIVGHSSPPTPFSNFESRWRVSQTGPK